MRARSSTILSIASLILGLFATSSDAQIPQGDITIQLELVADALDSPILLTHAGDGSGRLFIVDQAGQIWIVDGGVLLPTPFLDLTGTIVTLNTSFDERGLLGLAFHPSYEDNGRLFVRYSGPRAGDPSDPCFGSRRGCHEEILAEFRVSSDPNVADPTPRILFRIDEPQFNHDGGDVVFGPARARGPRSGRGPKSGRGPRPPRSARSALSPSSFLFFTLGDGGGAHDGLADTPPSHGPFGNGQNKDTALGAILRIDIDSPPSPGLEYAIPPDNPFVGVPGVDEIYAYGLRNPYRFSFDDGPGGDGRMFLSDVGQNLIEEISIGQLGANYGWVIREGSQCFDPFNPRTPPAVCPDIGADGEPLVGPIAEYDHSDGIAVIGGFVYRGKQFKELVGKYVFGDFSLNFFPPSGRLFWLDADGDLSSIFEFKLPPPNDPLGLYVKGFGEDEDGEVYLMTSVDLGPGGSSGQVWRITKP